MEPSGFSNLYAGTSVVCCLDVLNDMLLLDVTFDWQSLSSLAKGPLAGVILIVRSVEEGKEEGVNGAGFLTTRLDHIGRRQKSNERKKEDFKDFQCAGYKMGW